MESRLIKGDCLVEMQAIKDKSIDANYNRFTLWNDRL